MLRHARIVIELIELLSLLSYWVIEPIARERRIINENGDIIIVDCSSREIFRSKIMQVNTYECKSLILSLYSQSITAKNKIQVLIQQKIETETMKLKAIQH